MAIRAQFREGAKSYALLYRDVIAVSFFDTDVYPLSHSDEGNDLWLREEFSPSLGGGVDDGIIAIEDAVGEPVGAQCLTISPSTSPRSLLHRALERMHIAGG